MRPLIPRVKTGDILKGTRNLRNYLHVASTLNYVQGMSSGMLSKKHVERIFKPCKNERFLVTVNTQDTFGVCSLDSEVVLLFGNYPHTSPATVALTRSARRGPKITLPSTEHLLKNNYSSRPKRMDSTIFSRWFIRTALKKTNVQEWDEHAYLIWITLHLNLQTIDHERSPRFTCPSGPRSPFYMGTLHYQWGGRAELISLFRAWVVQGGTRIKAHQAVRKRQLGNFGPCLDDIYVMRTEIEEWCSNAPRVLQRLKIDLSQPHQEVFENLLNVVKTYGP